MGKFMIDMKGEDEKSMIELSKIMNTSKVGALRYAVRNVTKCVKMAKDAQRMVDQYKLLNARTLKLLNDVLRSLPSNYQNPDVDDAFKKYFSGAGKTIPSMELEVGTS